MPTALSVAWTLVHEVIFYAIFSLFFISRIALLGALVLWGGAIIGLHWMEIEFGRYGWGYLVSPVNLCFLLGVAIYYATRGGVPRKLALAVGLLGICIVVWGAAQLVPPRTSIALGFGALLVFASSGSGISGPFAGPAVFLGAASYAIYLVHNPLEAAAVRLVLMFDPGASPGFVFIVISAMALIAGLAYHSWYERPALALARRTLAAAALPSVGQKLGSRR
jgi:peptidoglycan/LPS O-acetylase OafA/YrhL